MTSKGEARQLVCARSPFRKRLGTSPLWEDGHATPLQLEVAVLFGAM